MSDRARLVASLPHGPQDPVTTTPPRRPGSVRRTTALDQVRGELDEPSRVIGSGRDLLTRPDGTTEVLDEVRLVLEVDPTGAVAAVEVDPPVPALAGLVGVGARSGFRARAEALAPEHAARQSLLRQLLDDVPLAALISSYGMTREHPEWTIPPEAADRLTDLCAGWARGATMLGALGETGLFPVPIGPLAPPLGDPEDPLGWHDMGPMAPRSVRRVRRIDVIALEGAPPSGDPLLLGRSASTGALSPAQNPGDPFVLGRSASAGAFPPAQNPGDIVVDVHFRDSHLGRDEPEDLLHEYTLAATIDPVSATVASAAAVARTLPWPECPGALASVERVVGQPVAGLRSMVASELTGTSTCTHLNDLLRSLAGAAGLVGAL